MKKTIIYTFAMVFVAAFGTAYAADYNGVTDFSGKSYDAFEIAPIPAMSVEGVSAGGLRASDRELYNGVTDFSGRSYDTHEIGMAGTGAMRSVEGISAGGVRAGDKKLDNGVTDFSGKSHDRFEIN